MNKSKLYQGILKTNLRGQIRQTPLPRWKALLPLFEAVMNSFQAIEDSVVEREHKIIIEIERNASDLFEAQRISGFTIRDTGVGFNDVNFDSFNTAFSEHKMTRGGKGLGRFMWLKAFDHVEIESVFTEVENGVNAFWFRHFTFDFDYDPNNVVTEPLPDQPLETRVHLRNFRSPYSDECSQDLDQLSIKLAEHFLIVLLSESCPTVEVWDRGEKIVLNELFRDSFISKSSESRFEIANKEFYIRGFRLKSLRATKHRIMYAANSRAVVAEVLDQFVPNLSGKLTDADGATFTYLAVVQGSYLNDKVNNFRTDFDLSEDILDDQVSFFEKDIPRSEIREKCIAFIEEDLRSLLDELNSKKSRRIIDFVQRNAPQYKPLIRHLKDFIGEISPTATNAEIDMALHRELHRREVQLKKEGAKILLEASKLKNYDQYRDQLAEFLERTNELGTSALTQYIVHRKLVIEFFQKALSLDEKNSAYPLEEAVHNLIFPMRSTDKDILYSQQNLWMIDERLTYHWFIASDKALSSHADFSIPSKLRPDLLIFDRKLAFTDGEKGSPISSLVLVEFKRPRRNDFDDVENPVNQVLEQVKEIRTGQFLDDKGRHISVSNEHIPAFAYIICDITPKMRSILDLLDAKSTPDRQSYFGYNSNLGVYFEVIDYNKLLSDAQKKNRVFFEKLNLMAL